MKKINFGVLLIIISFLFIEILVVNEHVTKENNKNEIRQKCKSFYSFFDKSILLDEKYIANEKSYNAYLASLKNDLSNFTIKEDKLYDSMKQFLDNQFKKDIVLKNCNITCRDVMDISFNDEYVSVWTIADLQGEKYNVNLLKFEEFKTTVSKILVFKKVENGYKYVESFERNNII